MLQIEARSVSAPDIEQVYYEVDRRGKLEVLCRLIDLHDVRLGIVFCATKRMVDELTEHLVARGYAADRLHGDMSQAQRERVMTRFRKRAIDFLIATDVAARGLDINDIEVVFNFDLPNDSEDYVHRIGRTGRAGRSGRAVTFVAGREIYKLQHILRTTQGRIRRERVPSIEEVEEKRRNLFYEALRETLETGKYRRHDAMIDRLLDQGHSPTDIASALIDQLQGGAEPSRKPAQDQPPEAGPTRSPETRDPLPQPGREPERTPGFRNRDQPESPRPDRKPHGKRTAHGPERRHAKGKPGKGYKPDKGRSWRGR